ncbi:hypothetical protein AVEN_167371-1 [Araneus ventricosus]|uniref:Endonuclease/exonuclease/phosphatase domain-containing protein n=1 Tax=Araneus ventricosus TaxID=182803 RepID=A0A4Y2LWH5_ARAVE|nr:hypothetical protein AVEN_167371-1 [Araneus ventricosus]
MDSWYLFEDRYLVYRKDRGSSANSSRRGCGVLVAIKKCISSRKLDVPGLDLEAIWISDKLNHGEKTLLCVVYFPPSSYVVTCVKCFDCFEGFGFFDKIFICGDFNLSIYDDFCDHNNPIVSELSNFMNLFNLGQYNNILDCNNKYLDLILTMWILMISLSGTTIALWSLKTNIILLCRFPWILYLSTSIRGM